MLPCPTRCTPGIPGILSLPEMYRQVTLQIAELEVLVCQHQAWAAEAYREAGLGAQRQGLGKRLLWAGAALSWWYPWLGVVLLASGLRLVAGGRRRERPHLERRRLLERDLCSLQLRLPSLIQHQRYLGAQIQERGLAMPLN